MFEDFIQFVRTLYPGEETISLHRPFFKGNEKKYLNECIDSGYVSSVGKFVSQFEENFASYCGSKYAVAAVNGTAALHIALLVSGVEPDSEVITQPLTFVATVNAIRHANAFPVFVDVDKDTLGMSPEKLNSWLISNSILNKQTNKLINKTSGRTISAIVPMHTFGHPCRIDEIVIIANKFDIPVIEDAAESLGSFLKGKHTGTYGKSGVYSFNGNKTITTGGGGMIITDDEILAKHAKHITTTAKLPHAWEFIHDEVAYNYRLTNINAAVGVAQMEKLDEYIANKRETARLYNDFFQNSNIKFFAEPPNAQSNYWLNSVLFKYKGERDSFLKITNDNGIMTRPVWHLMNKLEMFKTCQTGDLTNAEWLEQRIVNIPSSVRY